MLGNEDLWQAAEFCNSVLQRENLPYSICGQGNLRRTHKDFADVVELIAIRKLDGSFASLLHKSLRKAFRELVRNANS